MANFNRAPLQAGLDYWVNDSGLEIAQIAESFFDQAETQAKYPEGTSDADFVTAIFNNIFDRDPSAEGLAYWTDSDGLGGGVSRANMIRAVANGATGTDAEILANKTEVGIYYAQSGLTETDYSLDGVTADDATVTAAQANIDDLVPPTFTIDDVSVAEGDAGTTTATFTVTLSKTPGTGETVTVDYATADGTAAAGTDYFAATGTLTFAEGETFGLLLPPAISPIDLLA